MLCERADRASAPVGKPARCQARAAEACGPEVPRCEVLLRLQSTEERLGISVTKGAGGWLVLFVRDGPIHRWNQSALPEQRVVPGDKILSADGVPLCAGVELRPLSASWLPRAPAELRLSVAKAEKASLNGRDGRVIWEAGSARRVVVVLWSDGDEGALIEQHGTWQPVPVALTDRFLGGGDDRVDCSNMSLGDEGAEAASLLLESLGGHLSVRHLVLNNNRITNRGAEALAEAIDRCEAVSQVDLLGNFFGADIKERIDSTLLIRRTRTCILTVHVEASKHVLRISLTKMSAEPFMPTFELVPGACVRSVRATVKAHPDAAGRRVVLLRGGPDGPELGDDESCDVLAWQGMAQRSVFSAA